jgi:hypothetical protein
MHVLDLPSGPCREIAKFLLMKQKNVVRAIRAKLTLLEH